MIYRSLSATVGAGLSAAAPLVSADLRERLGRDPVGHMPEGIWVHGASVGELNSARAIIVGLAQHRPVLVTANTTTGRAVAQSWGLPARLAPLDVPQAVGRFLDALRPTLALTIENEIWPNRAAALRDRGVPQAVIGARMSARSARAWARLRGLIAPVLGGIDLLSAQDAETEARLIDLGLPRDVIAPRTNLKLIGPALVEPPPDTAARTDVWLAASTHPGEEQPVLAAHLALRQRHPQARLILAPRHPRRADEVAQMIAATGLDFDRLGAREVPDVPAAPVLLIDRLGAMAGAYAAAGVCLTGGSLVDHGGHTPWEPAAYACAILHGPHVENSAAGYAILDAAGAAVRIEAGNLADTLAVLMDEPDETRRMGHAARAALDAAVPDPAPLIDALLVLAAPLSCADRPRS